MLTVILNYYPYFWKGVAARIKYLVGIKCLLPTFSSCLVCAQPEVWISPGVADVQVSRAVVLSPSCPHPLSSPCAEFHFLHVQLYKLLNNPHLVLGLCTVRSYMSTPHLIATLIALYAPVFFPRLLDQREGLLKGESKPVLSGYGLSHFPGCTHSECLEKCPSKSLQIKRCRQMQR